MYIIWWLAHNFHINRKGKAATNQHQFLSAHPLGLGDAQRVCDKWWNLSHAERQSQWQAGKQPCVSKLHGSKAWVCGRHTPQGCFRGPDKAWLSAWTVLLCNSFPFLKAEAVVSVRYLLNNSVKLLRLVKKRERFKSFIQKLQKYCWEIPWSLLGQSGL